MLRFLTGLLLASIAVLLMQEVVIDARRGVEFLRDVAVGYHQVATIHSVVHPIDYPKALLAVALGVVSILLLAGSISRRRTSA